MQKSTILFILTILIVTGCKSPSEKGLKDVFNAHFLTGTALNKKQISESDPNALALVNKHFNSIVAENCMKIQEIQPREGDFQFADADKFVAFGEKNNLHMVGHTLIWHSQCPDWFFLDKNGNQASAELLKQRMKNHIFTLVGRYKGRIKVWDVVNEALEDNGDFRNSKFMQILGEDYIRLAFEFAHEADPEAQLCYNDYLLTLPAKREAVVRLVRKLQQQGVKIDIIGMQEHNLLHTPTFAEMEEALTTFSNVGVQVMITELDVSALPWPGAEVSAEVSNTFAFRNEYNPYPKNLPDSVSDRINKYYIDLFALYVKHSDKIARVNFWGLTDKYSWRNNWPVKGRTDYPLLFDRDYNTKAAVDSLISLYRQ